MADRIADVDDTADWPDLEEDLVPEDSLVPDAGPFERPFEYLHGARVTLDSDLKRATKLLTATAARSLLRVADETDTPVSEDERAAFERVAAGDIPASEDALVEALGDLTAFVEQNITLGGDE